MWYVYILSCANHPSWHYVGSTDDVERRFHEHELGLSLATKGYRPLMLTAYIAVGNVEKARSLEKYLKTGSGRAVFKKRILQEG